MKTLSSLFLLLLFSFIVQAQAPQGDSWSSVKDKKSGTLLCVWNESYGISYQDDTGKMRGVCVDLLYDLKAYVKQKYSVDLALEFVEEKSFSQFMSRVEKNSKVLGVTSVSISDERKQRFAFSPYYLSNPNVIVTHRDAPKLSSLDQLGTTYKGYTLKVVAGSTHKAFANSLRDKYSKDLTVQEATQSRDIFNEIASSKNVFAIIDFGEYLGAVKNKMPLVKQPVNLGFDDKLGFVMSKSNDWEPLWREFLTDSYRKSPAYRKIIADNLGSAYLTLVQ